MGRIGKIKRQLIEEANKKLLGEGKLGDERHNEKKQELYNLLTSIGMDLNTSRVDYADINNDGVNDTELIQFDMGNVSLYIGLVNFSNGEFKYLLMAKTKPDFEELIPHTFLNSVDEVKDKIVPLIEQGYIDTVLDYLGVDGGKEYVPSVDEYNKMIDDALDSGNWDEVRRLNNEKQKHYGGNESDEN